MTAGFPAQCDVPSVALVLAGGLGTRLRAVLADRPKSLAPAAGKPFLHYILDYLQQQGLRRVILCVGYLAGQVRDFARDGQDWGLEVTYSLEQTALGTGGALRQASAGLDEPFFALNGDTLFRVDLPALWEQHTRMGGLATVALLRVADGVAAGSARGCVRLAEDGHILAFDEKPVETPRRGVSTSTPRGLSTPRGISTPRGVSTSTPRGVSTSTLRGVSTSTRRGVSAPFLVNGGVYVLEPSALAEIQPGQAASIERDVFPRLASHRQLAGKEQSAYFADIGTPESLAAFERDVMRGYDGQ
jgi:NDP-sugar pyrophosphorylase family protein